VRRPARSRPGRPGAHPRAGRARQRRRERGDVGRLVVGDDAVAAGGLRGVQRAVGVREQLVGVHAVADRDQPDAQRDGPVLVADDGGEPLRGDGLQVARDLARRHHVGAAQDRGELIAAEPRHAVGRAQSAAQRVAEPRDHGVAGRVAVRVVDRLEAVDVEQQQDAAAGRARRQVELALQLLLEAAPVVDAAERVVVGEEAQALLGGLALGHVEHLHESVERMSVGVAYKRGAQVEPHARAVRAHHAVLVAVNGVGAAHQLLHPARERGRVPGVDQRRQRARADELVALAAEHAREAVVRVEQHVATLALDADDRHPRRRVVERAAEALLRLALRGLGRMLLGDVARRSVDQMAFGVDPRVPLDQPPAAVLRAVAVHESHAAVAAGRARGFGLGALAVVGMDELEERSRHQLLARPAEAALPRAVQVREVAVERRRPEQVARELEVARARLRLGRGRAQAIGKMPGDGADQHEHEGARDVRRRRRRGRRERRPRRVQREAEEPGDLAGASSQLDADQDDRQQVEDREAARARLVDRASDEDRGEQGRGREQHAHLPTTA
jgi:hypothetical protein